MARINTYLSSYDAGLRPEPTENTWEELRNTLGYVKDKKVPVTIEVVGEHMVILGCYFPDSRTYLRVSLCDARING